MARGLSKSKLMSFLQCPKRLWLEAHRPELALPPDTATRARLAEGAAVGEIARSLYGRDGGTLVSAEGGLGAATERTRQLLGEESSTPLFEATFQREGLLVRTDVLERTSAGARLVEVKGSASVKAEHLSDCAIQAWVLEASRVRPRSVAVAHVDTEFVYRGDGRYEGLLVEEDITESARALTAQVPVWLGRAKRTLVGEEPQVPIGAQCRVPYECPFVSHCWPTTEFPLTDLPGVHRNLAAYVARGYRDLRDVPVEEISSPQQERVWAAVRSGRATLEAGAAAELAALPWPRHHLDFETVAFAVPIWAGTRPYQALPFQWSLHIELSPGDDPVHIECLELDDAPPMRAVAERLVAAVGPVGPVFCYSGFEARCLATLAEFCPDLAPATVRHRGATRRSARPPQAQLLSPCDARQLVIESGAADDRAGDGLRSARGNPGWRRGAASLHRGHRSRDFGIAPRGDPDAAAALLRARHARDRSHRPLPLRMNQ